MKNIITILFTFLCLSTAIAQDNMHPTPPNKGWVLIENGTVHVGNGTVIENGSVLIIDDKISQVGTNLNTPANKGEIVNAKGKHIYPGIILSNSNLGLREINAGVRGSNDYYEIGDVNPNVRSIVAYNTDSKIINTLRSNGVLLVDVVPQGSFITGTSSIVQLDAWNWEDAAYKMDNGIHVEMPSLFVNPARNNAANPNAAAERLKTAYDKIEFLKEFFRQAKAYNAELTHEKINLKLESVKGLFDKSQTLFVHCDLLKEMLVSVDFAKEFGFKVCIVGGSESYQIAPLLAANNLSVILGQVHRLPTSDDDDVDQPYKTPYMLKQAGVQFSITDLDAHTVGRNLPFNAGTSVAYGLTKEQALQSITLDAARILGIDKMTGSLEIGKDANIVISTGDLLDMTSSNVTDAYIQGRKINLDDKHKQLNKRYTDKYGVKE